MKRLFMITVFSFAMALTTQAQDTKEKTKSTETIPQKVHNTFSKHKKHKGYKTKKTNGDVDRKKKVDYKHGEVKTKKDN